MRDLERDLRVLNICGRPVHQPDHRKSRNDSRPSELECVDVGEGFNSATPRRGEARL